MLGYLWLIDGPKPLREGELVRALASAADMAVRLYRMMQLERADRARERALAEAALGLSESHPKRVVDELLAQGILSPARRVVLAATACSDRQESTADAIQARIVAAVEHERRFTAPGELLVLVVAQHLLAILGLQSGGQLAAHVNRIAGRCAQNLANSDGWSAVVGVSGVHAGRSRLAIARSEATIRWSMAPPSRPPRARSALSAGLSRQLWRDNPGSAPSR